MLAIALHVLTPSYAESSPPCTELFGFYSQSPYYSNEDSDEAYEFEYYPGKTRDCHRVAFVGSDGADPAGQLRFYFAENAKPEWEYWYSMDVGINWQFSRCMRTGSDDVRFKMIFEPYGMRSIGWLYCTD